MFSWWNGRHYRLKICFFIECQFKSGREQILLHNMLLLLTLNKIIILFLIVTNLWNTGVILIIEVCLNQKY